MDKKEIQRKLKEVREETERKKKEEKQFLSDLKESLLTKEDVLSLAHEVAKEYIVPPQITNQIIKETTVEKPIKETIHTTERVEYDDQPIKKELGRVLQQLDEIKIPEQINVTELKEELKSDFSALLEHNINVLDMPNFRKLAMGLQSQVDSKEVPLTFSTGLTRTVNTITSNLSTGIAGSQSVIGGTAASETLTLSSTSHATKGKILFGTSAYDEVNNRLGIATDAPAEELHLVGTDTTGAGTVPVSIRLQPSTISTTYYAQIDTYYNNNNFLKITKQNTAFLTAGDVSGLSGAGIVLGINASAPTSRLELRTLSLGTTQTTTSGLALVNTTAAANNAQQISPAIRWSGNGWKTTATAASQTVDFRAYVLPVQGAAQPGGDWKLECSVNGSAYDQQMKIGIGTGAALDGYIAIGKGSICSGIGNTALGTYSNVGSSCLYSQALGAEATVSGTNTQGATAVGRYALVSSSGAYGIGTYLSNTFGNSFLIGNGESANAGDLLLNSAINTIGFGAFSRVPQFQLKGLVLAAASWTSSGTTVTKTAHGLTAGEPIILKNGSNVSFFYGTVVSITDADNFVVSGTPSTTSGTHWKTYSTNNIFNITNGTNGTVLATMDKYGKFGIGTTSPDYKLDIEQAANNYIRVYSTDANTTPGVVLQNDAVAWALENYGSGSDRFRIYNVTGAVEALTVATTGNVGIGTTAPGVKLEVSNSAKESTLDTSSTLDVIGTSISSRTDNTVQTLFRLHQPNTAATQSRGSAFGIGLSFYEDPGNNYPRTRVDFRTTGVANDDADLATTVMSLMDNGSVGIGTTTPTAVLHLKAGTAAASTAPLKFTTGTLNTVAEAGTAEFLAERFYLTPTSTARQAVPGVLFTQTNTVTVANTVTETAITGTGEGSLTLPANFFVAGKTIRLAVLGVLSDTGTPTLRIRVKVGSTTVGDTGAIALVGTVANDFFQGLYTLTCRTTGATGTVIGQGSFQFDNSTNSGLFEGMPSTGTTTIDTTASQAISVTAEWGTADAANTISATNMTLEVLN